MDSLHVFASILAHILIGFYFAFAGIWNIYHWRPILITMAEKNIPHPWFLLPLAICWQTVAGVMIMFNIYMQFAALALLPFTVLAVWIFHPFWKFKGELRALNMAIFITNMTVTIGGLLTILS